MSHEREFLRRLIRETGRIHRRRFDEASRYSEKARFDLVSDVDLEVEEFLVGRLGLEFPNDRVYSEETGAVVGAGERLWIVDPLDGTANFVFGVPHIACSIALEEDGQIVLGAVHNPIADELYLSEGSGVSYLNDRPITCSDRDGLEGSLIAVGASLTPGKMERILREWHGLFEVQRKGLVLLAPALNICNVARGRVDLFIDPGSEMEGQAAAAFILQNAGGEASNYDFTPWDHRSTGIIASNGRLHPALREIAGT